MNKFGKGIAFYLGTISAPSVMGPVQNYVYKVAGVQPGPITPEGVYARVVDGRTLYVNTTQQEKTLPIDGQKRVIISNRVYDRLLVLGCWARSKQISSHDYLKHGQSAFGRASSIDAFLTKSINTERGQRLPNDHFVNGANLLQSLPTYWG
jgi:hypothetical protein